MITLEPNARVLVICLPGIGDALMATPMIRLLKSRMPGVTIDAACMFGGVVEVFRRNPDLSTVHHLPLYGQSPLRGLRSAASLRNERYAVSILAYPAYRREYHAVHWLLGARRRVAHRFPSGHWSELGFLESTTVPVDFAVHNVFNNLNLLRPLGIDWRDAPRADFEYVLRLSAREAAEGAEAVRSLGFDPGATVAIHPGSTASEAGLRRRWLPERWTELFRHLVDDRGRRVLVFAGPDEGDLGETLVAAADRPNKVVLARPRDFAQAMAMLASCELLVHSDNGFGHLAVALGVRTVSLFAVTDYRWSGPYSERLCRIVHPEPFEPWHRYELKRGVPRGARDAMRELSVADVRSALERDGHLP